MTVDEFLNMVYSFKKLSGLVESLQEVTVWAQIPLQVRNLFVLYELASSTEHYVVANFFFFFFLERNRTEKGVFSYTETSKSTTR